MDTQSKTINYYGTDDPVMRSYFEHGERKAFELENRGPIKFNSDGTLDSNIVESYSEYGFYVFEDVLGSEELRDLEQDLLDIIERFPTNRNSTIDKKGRPAISINCEAPTLFWSKPLGDPFGGTKLANGRHPVKMIEPRPQLDAPFEIVYLILGSLQFSKACLRTYGHPDLLRVAAAINGDDFVPFTEALFIKEPGLGASVAWHRDGSTHWESPSWDQGTHGFNFMVQLYGCTAANGVWVVPGTHKLRHVDIARMVEDAKSEQLPDAVPMICSPGDVVISNRQVVHGSFANTSIDRRITINQGFHRRDSVLNVTAGGLHNARATYDESRISKRSAIICKAIVERQKRFPYETPFNYEAKIHPDDLAYWSSPENEDLHDYNLMDLSI
jgi:hypothetical protein